MNTRGMLQCDSVSEISILPNPTRKIFGKIFLLNVMDGDYAWSFSIIIVKESRRRINDVRRVLAEDAFYPQ